jgi:hypothetical protein
VTNNNGFWIGWLDFLTPLITSALNYNQFTTAHNQRLLKTRSILLNCDCLLFCGDWLGSDLRIGHFFSFRCPLVETPQLTTKLNSTTELNSITKDEFRLTCELLMNDTLTTHQGPMTNEKSESESELLYNWRLTANQFVLAPGPLRPTTSDFF